MALIKCPECGKEISDKAASCPHCGCPVGKTEHTNHLFDNIESTKNVMTDEKGMVITAAKPKQKKGGLGKKILIGVGVVFAFFVVLAMIGGDSSKSSSVNSDKQTAANIDVPVPSQEFKDGSALEGKDYESAFKIYQKGLQEKACTYCMASVADYTINGIGGAEKDINKGLELAKKSADANNPFGNFLLGVYYLDGKKYGTPLNAESGLKYMTRGIELSKNSDNADVKIFAYAAAYNLATYYENGNTPLGQDYNKAVEYLKMARDFTTNEKQKSNIDKQIFNIQNMPDFFSDGPAPIVREYEQNEIAADNKYKGKTIRIDASIDDIGKDLLDTMYITLRMPSEWDLRTVQCFFDDKHVNEIANLRRGQRITVQGTVDGLMMNVLLKDCWIVKE